MRRGAVALVLGASIACRDQPQRAGAPTAGRDDTGFATLQSRGESAMGVDQYTSAHRFEPLSDGGRIELQRDSTDRAGVQTIRAHMRDIADRFSRGDFTIPGFVHARDVPGTRVMAERKAQITYEARDLPGGGEVRIRTSDPIAVDAIHEFLAFQRTDHRAH
jgi:hypothetical protein